MVFIPLKTNRFAKKQIKPLNQRRFIAIQVAYWVLVAILTYYYTIITGLSGNGAFLRTIISILGVMALAYLVINWVLPKAKIKGIYWFVTVFTLLALLTAGLRWIFEAWIYTTNQIIFPNGGSMLFLANFISSVITPLVFSGLYLWFENEDARQKIVKLESERLRAEINALKAYVNPHFLFNSLNNIYSLAVLQKPNTPDAILALAEVMRYITYDSGLDAISLQRELEAIKVLCQLEKLKGMPDSSLNMVFPPDHLAKNILIQPMLLFPLVENAFKYGLNVDNPNVSIFCNLLPDTIQFSVVNYFLPNKPTQYKSGGQGLANLSKRLELIYGGTAKFITHIENSTFTARIILPL